jgi:D-sedoheptulose 7-phosphate isomerase
MKQEAKLVMDGLLARLPELEPCAGDILSAFGLLRQCYENGGTLLACGNGGSAADARHIAGELMKGFLLKRPIAPQDAGRLRELFPETGARLAVSLQRALPAIALPDQTTVMTAFSNDVAADMAFAQLVYGYGKPEDVLLAISTSGNAANVVNAAMVARAMGLKTAGLTGQGGGRLTECCDTVIRAPASETYRVQEYHLCIYHALCAMLEMEFYG